MMAKVFRRISGCILFSMALTSCRGNLSRTVPEEPMPPNTVLLAQMLREQPGFTETLLSQLNQGGKKGPALLTPKLIDELRKRILGKDWAGLDRFPGWTMREINPAVDVASDVAGKGTASPAQLLDVGPYALDKAQVANLIAPSTLPGFSKAEVVKDLTDNIHIGDGPNALAPEHSESLRLADLLNRLSINSSDGAQHFQASVGGKAAATPQELIALLQQTGHDVTVSDARYFANFAHLHYQGKDVMAPFWINTQLIIPDSGGRPLLIPVSHAEYEWRIRGPLVNADVSWYFGIDGKAEFRTMDTLDQSWVLGRHAHEYRDKDAVEVTRLTGRFTAAYMRLHQAHPELPFGGYYALGVCQDSISAIELHMTGATTLFPNTADASFFSNPLDAEITKLIAAIPKDRDGTRPTPERIFGSLPTEDFNKITVPGLADDLNATHTAWKNGSLQRTRTLARMLLTFGAGVLLAGVTALVVARSRREVRS